jgi:hypothetical protein
MDQRQYGRYGLMTMLPGAAPIDLHVTDGVLNEWKARCGVLGFVLTN